MYGEFPLYLKDLLIRQPKPKHNLRSSIDVTRLIIPRTKLKTFVSCSFSAAAPTEWNLLPRTLRECESYELFKKQLKTELFKNFCQSKLIDKSIKVQVGGDAGFSLCGG